MKLLKNLAVFFNIPANERRKTPRLNVLVPCHISNTPFETATICDISTNGCKLKVNANTQQEYFFPGNKYVLEVSPKPLAKNKSKEKNFPITATLVWKNKTEKMVQLGFRIAETDDAPLHNWLDFVDKQNKIKLKQTKRLL